jgi:hypothetical protein
MPELAGDAAPTLHRNIFMIKGHHIGAFFLNSAARHFVWTFDPRLTPPLYWYEHQTREIAQGRFDEFVAISKTNGWTIAYDGPRNFG